MASTAVERRGASAPVARRAAVPAARLWKNQRLTALHSLTLSSGGEPAMPRTLRAARPLNAVWVRAHPPPRSETERGGGKGGRRAPYLKHADAKRRLWRSAVEGAWGLRKSDVAMTLRLFARSAAPPPCFRLHAPRFGGLKPAVARPASERRRGAWSPSPTSLRAWGRKQQRRRAARRPPAAVPLFNDVWLSVARLPSADVVAYTVLTI